MGLTINMLIGNHPMSFNDPSLMIILMDAMKPMISKTIPIAISILSSFLIFSPVSESISPDIKILGG
jgi:hypothetical protein